MCSIALPMLFAKVAASKHTGPAVVKKKITTPGRGHPLRTTKSNENMILPERDPRYFFFGSAFLASFTSTVVAFGGA